MIPNETHEKIIDVPPILIRGKGCPVTGNKFTPTPILIRDGKTIKKLKPKTTYDPNKLSVLFTIRVDLKNRMVYNITHPTPPNMEPNSSIDEA